MNVIAALLYSLVAAAPAAPLGAAEIRDAYYRSYTYERMADYDNAIRAIAPVQEAYREGYTVNLRLGWLYYLKQNYANASKHYTAAIKSAPESIEAKLGATLPLLAQTKYADVEAVCSQILTRDFYNATANTRLAYVLRLQGKTDLAEKVLYKMLALYPIDVTLLTELGLVKAAKGDAAAAAAVFGDVLVLDPENVTAKQYFAAGK